MTRKTSIKTYRQIESEGLLSKLRWVVYKHIFEYGPLTQKQAVMKLGRPGHDYGSFTTRFSELEKRGLIAVVGEVKCEFTGRMVCLWDVTSDLPCKPERKESHKEKIKRLEKEILAVKLRMCRTCKERYAADRELPF